MPLNKTPFTFQNDHQNKPLLGFPFFILVLICLVPFALNQTGVSFGISDPQQLLLTHTLFEWTAAILAFFCAIMAILFYVVTGEEAAFIIGMAFFFSGAMDTYHILVADGLFLNVHDVPNFNPFTGAISRLGAVLIKSSCAGVLLLRTVHAPPSRNHRDWVLPAYGTGLLSVLAIGIFYFCPHAGTLPKMLHASHLIPRPWDVPALSISLLAALFIYPPLYYKQRNVLTRALALSALPDVLTQAYLAFGSHSPGDNAYWIAHSFKILAYGLPLWGICTEFVWNSGLSKRLQDIQRQLEQPEVGKENHDPATEALLRELGIPFQTLIEYSSDIVLVMNRIGTIEYTSPSCSRMLGYEPTELRGVNAFSLVHPADLPKVMLAFTHSLATPGSVQSVEHRIRHKTGVWLSFESVGSYLTSASDRPFIVVNSRDVTARVESIKNLHLLKQAVDSASDAIAICDALQPDTPILYINPAFERITGYSIGEVIGKNPRILQGTDTDQPGRYAIKRALSRGSPISVTLRNYRKDGTMFWTDVRITPVSDESGKLTHWVGIKRDVTDRLKAEEALSTLHERQQLLLDSAEEGIYGMDLQGRCTFANLSCARTLGYPNPDHLVGKDMHTLIHDMSPDGQIMNQDDCHILQGIRRGESEHADDEVYRRMDGSHIPVEYWSHPIKKDRVVVGAVVSFMDITARKKMQSLLIQSEKLSSLGQLAAGTAHELNNPLTGILGFAQMMLSDPTLSPQQREDLSTIQTQGRRCQTIIQNLLQFSHPHEDIFSPVQIKDVLEQVVHLVEYDWASSGFTLEVRAKSLPAVYANADQLLQVFLNLITNARHAMKTTEKKVLTISVAASDTHLSIQFADSGTGIAPENMGRVFDPFFTTKPVGEGTGLGLSICYGIIQKHKGRISVESTPEQGATFTIELPLYQPPGNGPNSP